MARRKSERKEGFTELPNAFKHAFDKKGRWNSWFQNSHPLVIEVGCGKGDFSIGLAAASPNKNFCGLDLKSDRLWVAAHLALNAGLKNICFHRLNVEEIAQAYEEGEVDEIWITFPDPFPKKRQTKNRLTHLRFLIPFSKILKPGGLIHFKTDNTSLFDWTIAHFIEIGQPILAQTKDLHNSPLLNSENQILTAYERRFLKMGKTTCYLKISPPVSGYSKAPSSIEEKALDDQ